MDSDTVMYFTMKGAQIAAQSESQLDPADKLMSDFRKDHFFDVKTFSFGLRLAPNEGVTRGAQLGNSLTGVRPFERWFAMKNFEAKPNPPYQAQAEDFVITRKMDSASPILMQYCLNGQRLDKGVLIKRGRSGPGLYQGFMRMEFEKIWLKGVHWNDGDGIYETCRFQFTSVSVTYLKRKPDGSTESSWPCKWNGLANG